MSSESLKPSRAAYLSKFSGGLIIAAMGTVGGQLLITSEGAQKWIAIGLILAALILFFAALKFGRARDEFEEMIDLKAGHYAGITTIGLIIGLHLAADLNWLNSNAVPVYALPGFFLMYKTLTTFMQRDSYAVED